MSEDEFCFNGINGATGGYLWTPRNPTDLLEIARQTGENEEQLAALQSRSLRDSEPDFGLTFGRDPADLASAGWGVVFPRFEDPARQREVEAVRAALRELLDHRKAQAGDLYREIEYVPGTTKPQFLSDFGMAVGDPVDPTLLPYYLLLVGDPETIPFIFQYQLDVEYAVGRLHFETAAEYANYARSVVAVEKGEQPPLPRRAALFGARHDGDASTMMSADELITPLRPRLQQPAALPGTAAVAWDVPLHLAKDATKAQLGRLLGGPETPALLFTASHGMGFPNQDPRQLPHQGALLCSDWPGPLKWAGGPVGPEFYFAGEDVGEDARLLGMISFNFACYGAGTPRMDDFAHRGVMKDELPIAPHAFVSRLPQRLLGHPKGGALAMVGHVERAWGYSFMRAGKKRQLETFASTLACMMAGQPLGWALEDFNKRYAALATELTQKLYRPRPGTPQNAPELSAMWTAHNDARSYVIFGDPAVRLSLEREPAAAPEAGTIERIQITSAGGNGAVPAPEAVPERQPVPVETTAQTVHTADDLDFGFMDAVKGVGGNLQSALQQFTERLGSTLEQMMKDTSSLEVTTYAAGDLDRVQYNTQTGKFNGARLRALTRIEADGDTMVCVPETDGEVDKELWEIHSDTVKQAQEHRTEMLRTLIRAATELLSTLKPG